MKRLNIHPYFYATIEYDLSFNKNEVLSRKKKASRPGPKAKQSCALLTFEPLPQGGSLEGRRIEVHLPDYFMFLGGRFFSVSPVDLLTNGKRSILQQANFCWLSETSADMVFPVPV